jgi:hypothetical protein
MQPNLVRKFNALALICLFSCFAGVMYQLINEKRLDYNSVLVGFPLGIAFGLLELFLFPKAELRFRRWSFTKIFLFQNLGLYGCHLCRHYYTNHYGRPA